MCLFFWRFLSSNVLSDVRDRNSNKKQEKVIWQVLLSISPVKKHWNERDKFKQSWQIQELDFDLDKASSWIESSLEQSALWIEKLQRLH